MIPSGLSHLTIRRATNNDLEAIVKLVFGVLREFGLEPDPAATDADLQDIEANYLESGGLFEVIEDPDGNLVGSVGIFPIDENTCELRKMYFTPAIRGLGLGGYVLERAVSQAKELGFTRMVLETSSKLLAANRLYIRFGFQPFIADHLARRADQSYSLDLTEVDSIEANA
ncbi:MAG: GNAT family N-acetyltransferase [Pyrinomonadaceae bacterium]|nr:GNAT family N-acetyltransferase [Pyrinomonadaceae bacterium]